MSEAISSSSESTSGSRGANSLTGANNYMNSTSETIALFRNGISNSRASNSATLFSSNADDSGAGSSREATATSPTGETSTRSSSQIFTPGATSSSGSAEAIASLEPETISNATT